MASQPIASPTYQAASTLNRPGRPFTRSQSEVDVLDSDLEENLGQADDEDSDHDDNKDSDFKEWQSYGSEESENFSLDEEDDLELKNESLGDIDLETDTQLCMTLGHGSIDDDMGANLLIVNKMAKKTLIRRFGVAVPDYTCRRTRRLIKHMVEGRHDEGYEARFKFDQTLKLDDNTNNFTESFNNAIMKHRGKPT
ncbi:hypothetical protein Cgig2_007781 [Carnegiea gigantea]|uniref:Uncharacterized protein n=1 Tax=Carnegiea gigantea TaxID=171969 RepID=A0A9Q1K2B4_9CARY|nr:hypothetical protein Cgig2_007781 [Carnegiea gigantea]